MELDVPCWLPCLAPFQTRPPTPPFPSPHLPVVPGSQVRPHCVGGEPLVKAASQICLLRSWAPALMNRLYSSSLCPDVSGFALFQVTGGRHRGVRHSFKLARPKGRKELFGQIPPRTWKRVNCELLKGMGCLNYSASMVPSTWTLSKYLQRRQKVL